MQNQKKNITNSLNCRNGSFRKIQHHLYFQLLVHTRRKPGNGYFVVPCVKMSPQYVIHVTALSSGLATGATRSLCSGATDIFTFPDHLTHKMCCINKRLQKNYEEKESNDYLSVQHVFGRTGHKTNSVILAQDISVEFACIYNGPFSNPNAGILITAICSPQNKKQSASN